MFDWPRVHGGTDAQGPVAHDFSTNSNACGPCPMAAQAVREAPAHAYPDPNYTVLKRRLARWHAVDPERVLLAASASEFVYRITAWQAWQNRGLGPVGVALPAHHYGDYASAAQVWGLQRTEAAHAHLLWACDPSSPLGQDDDLGRGWVEGLHPGQALVLDCAYEPLRLQGQSLWQGTARDRVWQLWTPNKALGLTGVRAAYVVAPQGAQAQVRVLEAMAPSWPVGAHGVALLHVWSEPATHVWLAQSRATLRQWRQRQTALCAGLGWSLAPSVTNYAVVTPPTDDLPALTLALRQHGIKWRDATSFGLPGRVRVAVLPPPAQDALVQAWHHIQQHQRHERLA